PYPVTETGRLRAAPANIGERQTPQKNVVVLAENEEGIGEVIALVFRVPPDAPAKGCAGEIVGGPGRLPGREKIAACFPQRCPIGAVGHLRPPQDDTSARDRGPL